MWSGHTADILGVLFLEGLREACRGAGTRRTGAWQAPGSGRCSARALPAWVRAGHDAGMGSLSPHLIVGARGPHAISPCLGPRPKWSQRGLQPSWPATRLGELDFRVGIVVASADHTRWFLPATASPKWLPCALWSEASWGRRS